MDATSRRDFLRTLGAGVSLGALGVFDPALLRAPLGTPVGVKRYTNPVYAGSMPDPGVMLHEGVYYAFGTTGQERKADGRIFTLLRSTDLVTWEELGGALTPPDADARYNYWAPEAAYSDGTFYLYYAMGGVEEEKFAVRVATSQRPEGPYTDTGTPLVD
jgi:arabinan endo-1,5-alpha-L-arabinosidase